MDYRHEQVGSARVPVSDSVRPRRAHRIGAIAFVVCATAAVALPTGADDRAWAAPDRTHLIRDHHDADGEDASQHSFDPLEAAAFADSPWWPEYMAMINYANTWLDVFRQVGFEKTRDASSDFVNVRSGRRATWIPPPCADCPGLTVWFYGSATGLGLGQRDDHTIASQVAKLAWDDRVRLEVVNRSSPGDQHWQQADRFAWDLSRHPAPDVVVFYTGVSDVNAALHLAERGLGDVDRPVDTVAEGLMADELFREIADKALRGGRDAPPPPEGVRVPEHDPVPEMTPEKIGSMAAERYAGSLDMSRDLVELHDIEGLWIWEPMRLGRGPVEGEPVIEGDDELRVVVESAEAGLPDDVVDLTRLFAGDPRPYYYDDVHHNERAAAIVADALWDLLRPAVTRTLGG